MILMFTIDLSLKILFMERILALILVSHTYKQINLEKIFVIKYFYKIVCKKVMLLLQWNSINNQLYLQCLHFVYILTLKLNSSPFPKVFKKYTSSVPKKKRIRFFPITVSLKLNLVLESLYSGKKQDHSCYFL